MSVSQLLDPKKPLYQENDLISEKEFLQMQTWRGQLKECDYVDTLMEQGDTQVGWATAKIKIVTGDNLTIELDTKSGENL